VSAAKCKYKPYPKYKDSGVEWIGHVPEHWDVKPLWAVADCNREKLRDDEVPSTEIDYVDISAVTYEGGISSSQSMLFGNAPSRARRKAEKGDIAISTVRTYLKAVAEVAEEFSHCVFSTGFAIVHPKQLIHQPFLRWTIPSSSFVSAVESHSEGVSYPAINAADLMKLKVIIPPSSDCQTIANFIERECGRIDKLVKKKLEFIALLKEKRQALITHAVTKGLDPNVEMKDSGVEWLGEVPKHWDVKRLRHVASFSNSNVDKKSYEGQKSVLLCNYTDVYYNEFIRSGMEFMEATASDAEVEKFQLRKGQIIITKDSEDPTDIGVPALVAEDFENVICGYHLTVIYPPDPNTGRYLHRSIQSMHTRAHFYVESPGITRYGLNQDAIGDIPVALPPKAERKAIADHIDRETTRIDQLISKTQESIDLLKERKTSLITAAVTGQIDVSQSA